MIQFLFHVVNVFGPLAEDFGAFTSSEKCVESLSFLFQVLGDVMFYSNANFALGNTKLWF